MDPEEASRTTPSAEAPPPAEPASPGPSSPPEPVDDGSTTPPHGDPLDGRSVSSAVELAPGEAVAAPQEYAPTVVAETTVASSPATAPVEEHVLTPPHGDPLASTWEAETEAPVTPTAASFEPAETPAGTPSLAEAPAEPGSEVVADSAPLFQTTTPETGSTAPGETAAAGEPGPFAAAPATSEEQPAEAEAGSPTATFESSTAPFSQPQEAPTPLEPAGADAWAPREAFVDAPPVSADDLETVTLQQPAVSEVGEVALPDTLGPEERRETGPNWMLAFICAWSAATSLHEAWLEMGGRFRPELLQHLGFVGYLLLGVGLAAFAVEALGWGKPRRSSAVVVLPALLTLAGVVCLVLWNGQGRPI